MNLVEGNFELTQISYIIVFSTNTFITVVHANMFYQQAFQKNKHKKVEIKNNKWWMK
jgi:hypothetical protein